MTKAAIVLIVGVFACTPNAAEQELGVSAAKWTPIEAPRSGLRCWYTFSVGHGAAYCEPDPSATHGASPSSPLRATKAQENTP